MKLYGPLLNNDSLLTGMCYENFIIKLLRHLCSKYWT